MPCGSLCILRPTNGRSPAGMVGTETPRPRWSVGEVIGTVRLPYELVEALLARL